MLSHSKIIFPVLNIFLHEFFCNIYPRYSCKLYSVLALSLHSRMLFKHFLSYVLTLATAVSSSRRPMTSRQLTNQGKYFAATFILILY